MGNRPSLAPLPGKRRNNRLIRQWAALSNGHPSVVRRRGPAIASFVCRGLPSSLLLPGFVDSSHLSPSPRKVRRYLSSSRSHRSESFPTVVGRRRHRPEIYITPLLPAAHPFLSPCNSALLPYPTSSPHSLFSPRLPTLRLDHSQSPNHLPTDTPLQAYQHVWSH